MSMAYALEHVAWEQPLLEPRPDPALESWARKKQGVSNPSRAYFSPVPWLARGLVDLHPESGLLIHRDQGVSDLVVRAGRTANSSRRC